MRHVLTAEAMAEADHLTIEDFGIPGFTLMETAGRHVAKIVHELALGASKRPIVLVCGVGNNGGDALVAARVLHEMGHRTNVVLAGNANRQTKDTAHNLSLLRTIDAQSDDGRLSISEWGVDAIPADVACIVDGLLGTGLRSDVREPFASVIGTINEHVAPVVAIDVPSGLHPNEGVPLGVAVRASTTVTMAAPKMGLLLNEGPVYAGRTVAVEIGIPTFVLDRFARASGCAWLPTREDVASRLPQRDPNAHKYRVGAVLAVAGSPGLTGAPVLASESALRVGAGAVVCACPESIQPVLSRKMTEVMTLGLSDPGGALNVDAALAVIRDKAARANALLVGCGLGRTKEAGELVTRLLAESELTTVIDADGLYALIGSTDLIQSRSGGRWILTPHKGEFDRLVGEETTWSDRVELARMYAAAWNCVLVLKGLPSVVADPDGNAYVSPTGNAALATAGTGDVLAGAIAGFAAQGLTPVDAAIAGLYTGGCAADIYAREVNAEAMIASDLIAQLPAVLRDLSRRPDPTAD